MPRPFRFAVTARWPRSGSHWRDVARRAEDLGYDVLLVTDHMGKQLAPIPALMAAADATTRLRVGSFVFANDYRNPVMLAKEVASLDFLSGGRVEVGIGAGWNTIDYRELGISYDAPGVRVSRLEESVVLLRRSGRTRSPSAWRNSAPRRATERKASSSTCGCSMPRSPIAPARPWPR